jgi:hypothetical protein
MPMMAMRIHPPIVQPDAAIEREQERRIIETLALALEEPHREPRPLFACQLGKHAGGRTRIGWPRAKSTRGSPVLMKPVTAASEKRMNFWTSKLLKVMEDAPEQGVFIRV